MDWLETARVDFGAHVTFFGILRWCLEAMCGLMGFLFEGLDFEIIVWKLTSHLLFSSNYQSGLFFHGRDGNQLDGDVDTVKGKIY